MTRAIMIAAVVFLACGGAGGSSGADQCPSAPPEPSAQTPAGNCVQQGCTTWLADHTVAIEDAYTWIVGGAVRVCSVRNYPQPSIQLGCAENVDPTNPQSGWVVFPAACDPCQPGHLPAGCDAP